MLQSKTLARPDKQLEKMLLGLVFALISMALSILMLFVFPEHSLFFLGGTLFLTVMSICFAISVISESEKALTYGGLANVILEAKDKICRIDNATFDPVIENKLSIALFADHHVLDVLRKKLFYDKHNVLNFDRLELALKNLKEENVLLALQDNSDIRWYKVHLQPLYLKKNDIFESDFSIAKIKKETYFFWQIEDVTAEENMEKVLLEERQKISRFIKDMPLGLYVLDHEGKMEYVNDTFAHMLDMKKDDLTGHLLLDFCADEKQALFDANAIQKDGLFLFKNNKGKMIQLFVSQNRYQEKGQLKTRGVSLHNLPVDKNLLAMFNRLTAYTDLLFDKNPLGILVLSENNKIVSFNANAQEIFATKLENQTPLSALFDKGDAKKMEKIYNNFLNNPDDNVPQKMEVKLQSGQTLHITLLPCRYLQKDEKVFGGLWLCIADMTKNKNLELQFSQAQKMQAMGQFAGGIAHDFNNLLTAIIGFCDLLLQRHRIGDPSFADLNEIRQNAIRAAALVRQLLAFSRQQPSNPKFLDVVDSFEDLNQLLKRILGEQIVLEFHFDPNLGFIRMDPVQFTQVMMNLAVNAKDAMNGKGLLKITTHIETLIEPYLFGGETIEKGDFVVISVSDTGCGIKEENLSRIFDPFFSTKQNVVGSGTGLGLATVYGIVRQTKGFLKVESKEGKGTTFKIYLPRFKEGENDDILSDNLPTKDTQMLTAVSNSSSKVIFGLNVSKLDHSHQVLKNPEDIKILFVEDEASVMAFGVRALKKKGFNVIACSSAESALEQKDSFDLMITDMVMPGMSGVELALKMKERQPNIKIIVASGYSEEIVKKELAGSKDFCFIAKPYSFGNLTKMVHEILNK